MTVTFKGKHKTAKHIYTFLFEPKKPVRYSPGQFIELKIPHKNPDERGDKHWFTLSSSPTDEMLSITTKIINKRSSFKDALFNLKPGKGLHMEAPMGDFVLPKDSSIPLMFVAGGIGCTPYHSIIKYLSDTGEKRDIQLLYAAKEMDEVAFRELFAGYLGKEFQITLNRLSSDIILELTKNPDERHIYISGPEPMVEALDKGIKKAGFPYQRIHTDFFPGYESV
jgi:ferredoxin-NADP reductase